MKFDCGLCSLQIFNAILLRFSRLLRNSPRPGVKHTRSPATPDSLEKPHQKAKSSMSLQPHQNFINCISHSFGRVHSFILCALHIQQSRPAWGVNSTADKISYFFFNTTSSIFTNNSSCELAWIRENPGESHPEQLITIYNSHFTL